MSGMITDSPIADRKRRGALDFEFVNQLIQLREVDSSAKPARFGMNSKSRAPSGRRRSGRQTLADYLIDDFLE